MNLADLALWIVGLGIAGTTLAWVIKLSLSKGGKG